MSLFRRTRLPSLPHSGDAHDPDELPGMPPRPQASPPLLRPRGAMVTEGPRDLAADPCGPPSEKEADS